MKVFRIVICDDDYDQFKDDSDGIDQANIDYEKFIDWFVRYVPYPLKVSEEGNENLTPRSLLRHIKV